MVVTHKSKPLPSVGEPTTLPETPIRLKGWEGKEEGAWGDEGREGREWEKGKGRGDGALLLVVIDTPATT